MQPFRLPAVARDLIASLLEEGDATAAARGTGGKLNGQGLSLTSLIEAQATTLMTIAEAGLAPATVGMASRFFGAVFEGFAQGEMAEVARERERMERALLASIEQQRHEETQLRIALNELSTPIVPVYQGILVVPLVGTIDSRRATGITERLLEAIAFYQADIVIIDITGVSVIDTTIANHLLQTVRAAELIGSQIVLVGIGAEIAQTIVHIGIALDHLTIRANLQSGIAHALALQGLAIQSLVPA
jgi:anti-anti-sigma regulatory factor